ncbi:hypothetical protein WH002_21675 [Klebsiella michiganensis]|uniref:hypothetical protein n=1 Tax=Klebsiella michiganensis TaxID=1134687 RepID=UPI00339BA412
MTSKLTREQATDTEIQMLIDSHEKGTAMFMRTDAYYFMAKELQERRKADSEPVATLDVQSRRPDGNKFALVFSSAAHKLPDDVYFLYRHAQQPVVPDNTQHFDTIALETAEEIMCDVNRRHEFLGGEIQLLSRIQCRIDDACRAAMLQESQKSAGESNNCRSCENVQDLQAGNSPVITGAEQRIADAVELLKKAAPAMLADNSGPNGPLAGRLKSPVIPEGYVMVPKEPTERMVIDGFESEPDETFSEPEVWEAFQKMSGCEKAAFRARLCWAAMLAAAPQELK